MLKYVDTRVTFAEIPDEITLCINLSKCPCHCEGCHSAYLAEDIGEPLIYLTIERLLDENKGITAICFMGGDAEPELINQYAKLIKESVIPIVNGRFQYYIPNPIKIGWYSGRQELSEKIDLANFNYIKLGPYIKEKGPLNNPNTNQKFYQIVNKELVDITYKFWKHEIKD